MGFLAVVFAALLNVAACSPLHVFDLRRAKTATPRPAYQGQGSLAAANGRLNAHLKAKAGFQFRDCEAFTVQELRDVLRALFPEASMELKALYSETDGRSARYSSIADMEEHWAEVGSSVGDIRLRDAHCHEAVMWFVHHLTSESQRGVALKLVLPLLPRADHTRSANGNIRRMPTDVIGKFYDEKVTCQGCHVGGVDSLGVPEEMPTTVKAKQRRCYTNYKELFNMTCGPCDGIAGNYWGDSDDDFTPAECSVVGTPEDIPKDQRVPAQFPSQFAVDVVWGADRFGRTTNPVKDALPSLVAKLYGEIYGKWFMDAKPGADLWLLRHDTTYTSVHENGFPIPFIAPSVTEIHAQTAKQRAENNTGPMVSLIHGLPSFVPGGCNCIPDPVGVPDVAASWAKGLAEDMQYLGRVKLRVEKLEETMELDHWASWFFHVYMDVDPRVPHYRLAPRRLSSAYAGVAVYQNWVFGDPKKLDPEVWTRGIPTEPERFGPSKGKMCMNPNKVAICDDVNQTSFPPKGEPAEPASSAPEAPSRRSTASTSAAFPSHRDIVSTVARMRSVGAAELIV